MSTRSLQPGDALPDDVVQEVNAAKALAELEAQSNALRLREEVFRREMDLGLMAVKDELAQIKVQTSQDQRHDFALLDETIGVVEATKQRALDAFQRARLFEDGVRHVLSSARSDLAAKEGEVAQLIRDLAASQLQSKQQSNSLENLKSELLDASENLKKEGLRADANEQQVQEVLAKFENLNSDLLGVKARLKEETLRADANEHQAKELLERLESREREFSLYTANATRAQDTLRADVLACLTLIAEMRSELNRISLSWVWRIRLKLREPKTRKVWTPPNLSELYTGSINFSNGPTGGIVRANKTLESLLMLSNDNFVDNLYRILLRREPDGPGREVNLAALSSGTDRMTLALDMAMSDEGKVSAVEVPELVAAIRQKRREKHWLFGKLFGVLGAAKNAYQILSRIDGRLEYLEHLQLDHGPGSLANSVSNRATKAENFESSQTFTHEVRVMDYELPSMMPIGARRIFNKLWN